MNRRTFLWVSAVSAASTIGLPSLSHANKKSRASAAMPDQTPLMSGSGQFRQHLNSEFVFTTAEGGVMSGRLDKVQDYGSDPNMDQFILQFVANDKKTHSDGLFTASHPSLGTFPIFLKAGGERNGLVYEAAFALLV